MAAGLPQKTWAGERRKRAQPAPASRGRKSGHARHAGKPEVPALFAACWGGHLGKVIKNHKHLLYFFPPHHFTFYIKTSEKNSVRYLCNVKGVSRALWRFQYKWPETLGVMPHPRWLNAATGGLQRYACWGNEGPRFPA